MRTASRNTEILHEMYFHTLCYSMEHRNRNNVCKRKTPALSTFLRFIVRIEQIRFGYVKNMKIGANGSTRHKHIIILCFYLRRIGLKNPCRKRAFRPECVLIPTMHNWRSYSGRKSNDFHVLFFFKFRRRFTEKNVRSFWRKFSVSFSWLNMLTFSLF